MKNKKKIGFIINFEHDRWLGGSNYFQNLFKGISQFSKNEIIIFTGIDKKKINPYFLKYKIIYLKILNPSKKINILINYFRLFCLIFFKRDFVLENILKNHKVDILSHSFPLGANAKIKSFCWIPDLQDLKLKKFFTFKQRLKRSLDRILILFNSSIIIFSCKTVKNQFIKIYPSAKKKSRVLKFINELPQKKPKGNLYKKFKNYFIISNQYWIHKNYHLVIDALINLKKKGFRPVVVSTGSKLDWRFNNYYTNLIKKIKKNHIHNFKILGNISRSEQLNLIFNAKYLINPSDSEGWNTALEEAKSLGTRVIASNIDVHKEQLGHRGQFFKTTHFKYLSTMLIKKHKIKKKLKNNYDKLLLINKKKFKIFIFNYFKILKN